MSQHTPGAMMTGEAVRRVVLEIALMVQQEKLPVAIDRISAFAAEAVREACAHLERERNDLGVELNLVGDELSRAYPDGPRGFPHDDVARLRLDAAEAVWAERARLIAIVVKHDLASGCDMGALLAALREVAR